MVGTPINLVRRLISSGLIKDPIMPLCLKTFENGERRKEERWSCQELNPRPLAYRVNCSATELQLPPATTLHSCSYVASSSESLIDCDSSCVRL